MGDRANIVLRDYDYVRDEDGKAVKNPETDEYVRVPKDLFLYTHWSGSEIEQIAADGIRAAIAGGRETDPQYGGRIITDVFLKAHADSPYTGAGVGAVIGDGESHLVTIDFDAQTVTYLATDDPNGREYGRGTLTTVSFAEYVAAFPAKEPASV